MSKQCGLGGDSVPTARFSLTGSTKYYWKSFIYLPWLNLNGPLFSEALIELVEAEVVGFFPTIIELKCLAV